jgi:hypothetical protein
LAGTLAVDVDEGGFHIHAATEVIAGGLNQQRTNSSRTFSKAKKRALSARLMGGLSIVMMPTFACLLKTY